MEFLLATFGTFILQQTPDLGRFLTKDTSKGFNNDPQTLNLYAYANNNPLIYVDPDGHFASAVADAAMGGLMAYLIYGFPRLISRIAISFGALPLPEGKSAMAGGDVKLATALAVLVGHIPVLYGTALASLLMILYYGVRAVESCRFLYGNGLDSNRQRRTYTRCLRAIPGTYCCCFSAIGKSLSYLINRTK